MAEKIRVAQKARVDQTIGSATLAKAIAVGNSKTLQKEGNGVAANGARLGHYADFSPSGRLVISRSSSASTVSAVCHQGEPPRSTARASLASKESR